MLLPRYVSPSLRTSKHIYVLRDPERDDLIGRTHSDTSIHTTGALRDCLFLLQVIPTSGTFPINTTFRNACDTLVTERLGDVSERVYRVSVIKMKFSLLALFALACAVMAADDIDWSNGLFLVARWRLHFERLLYYSKQ